MGRNSLEVKQSSLVLGIAIIYCIKFNCRKRLHKLYACFLKAKTQAVAFFLLLLNCLIYGDI